MHDKLDPRKPGGLRWHHISLTLVLVILLAVSWGAVGGFFVAQHLKESGGYKPKPLPASKMAPISTTPLGGAGLPASWSLERWSVRIHDQGNSNSCVSQTIGTMAEIYSKERHIPITFSGGYFWNLLNGGSDVGLTYQGTFPYFVEDGAQTLAHYPYDGQYVGPYPGLLSSPYRAASWYGLWSTDQVTIESLIHAGNPLAVAIPVYDSFYGWWGNGNLITGQWGAFLFYHSMVIVGYTPAGVILQNSWGANWGIGGRATISWGFLAQYAQAVVAAPPASFWPAYHPPKPKHKGFPVARWNAPIDRWNAAHPHRKRAHISYRWHGKLSRVASDVWHHGMLKRIGGPLRPEVWDPKKRVTHQVFGFRIGHPQATVWSWPTLKHDPLRYEAHHRTIRVSR